MSILRLISAVAGGALLAISLASYAEEDAAPIVRVMPERPIELELRVQPGMALRVQFACSPEVIESNVGADGLIELGRLGEIKVADLTFNELKSLLESRARDSLTQLVLRVDSRTWMHAHAGGTICNPTGDFPDPAGPPKG